MTVWHAVSNKTFYFGPKYLISAPNSLIPGPDSALAGPEIALCYYLRVRVRIGLGSVMCMRRTIKTKKKNHLEAFTEYLPRANSIPATVLY